MSFFYVDPDTYRRYRDEVLALSDSVQVNYPEHLSPDLRSPALSDEQIAGAEKHRLRLLSGRLHRHASHRWTQRGLGNSFRNVLCRRHRGPGQLQELTIRRGLGRPDNAPLPVWRGRL